ncbi:MAG: Fe-S cluster assembly protein SufD [Bacteroidota bacterium]|nr:Fe-S cluster assembly protein SufD [Bacteroidota bacterium]
MDQTEIINTKLTKELVEELAFQNNEPDWLRSNRLLAFQKFENSPMPFSKRIDYSHLQLENLSQLVNSDVVTVSKNEYFKNKIINQVFEKYSTYVIANEVKKKHVILSDMNSAVQNHPELLKQYLLAASPITKNNKFDFLNRALWNGGTFLYIPKNIQTDIPLLSLFTFNKDNSYALPYNLIILEEGSKVTLIDSIISSDFENDSLVSNNVDIILGANAKLDYIGVQETGKNVNHFATKRAFLKRDASLNWIEITLGSKLSKNNLDVQLEHKGAEAFVSGLFLAGKDQQFEFNTTQMHAAPHTKSDLLFVGALRENARTNYEGIIKVEKGAQKTDAYQKNKNLLLSKNARADSEPLLEIEANDVRCTHGATVGPVDKEDLFYLMSRGIEKELAKKLLIFGFFSKVVEKIPVEEFKNGLQSYIEESVTA